MRVGVLIVGVAILAIGLAFTILGLPKTETYTETVPVTVTKNTEWDVIWKTFTPEGEWGAEVGRSTFPSTFIYNWGTGKVYDVYGDYIGFSATAIINVPRSGPVSFTIGSDDGSSLYIDGQEVIDLWWDHGYITKTVVIELSEGKHFLGLLYYERTGGAKVSFSADSDVLTWEETEYQEVTKERLSTNTSYIAFGGIFLVIGAILATIGAITKPKLMEG